MTSVQHQRVVSPAPIMDLLNGFRAAKFLMAATELGLFDALADAPATIDALATRIGLTRRATRICADAMVARGYGVLSPGAARARLKDALAAIRHSGAALCGARTAHRRRDHYGD